MYDPAFQIRHHLCDEHMANLIETVMDAAVKAVTNPNYEFDDSCIRLDPEVRRMIVNKVERIKAAEGTSKYPSYVPSTRTVLREYVK